MSIVKFDAPAGLTEDLTTPELQLEWSRVISKMLNDGKAFTELFLQGAPSQFYNELLDNKDEADRVELPILWQGFPKSVERAHGEGTLASFKAAEGDFLTPHTQALARQQRQDEYLEWHVTRDPATQKITRVEFTCEGPEYWEFLALNAPDILLERYRTYISPNVQKTDLFVGNQYNPLNIWNSEKGAMHLTQGANTLNAEINIAAAATILRIKNNQLLTDANALIQCAGYGVASRASDPHIGDQVNQLARQGYSITLRNPIGLYIDKLDIAGFKKPDGTLVGNYFRILRGTPGQALRAVYEVPATEQSGGQPFVVGDIKIDGTNINFGGQIAKHITMKLTGVAVEKGKINSAAFGCGEAPQPPHFLAAPLVGPASFLSRIR